MEVEYIVIAGWPVQFLSFAWLITNGPLRLANSPIPIPIVAEALANGLEFLQGHSRSHNDRRGADGSEELAIGYCAPKQ